MTRALSSPILSEDFAAAMREGRIADAARVSPYTACLMPLLESLGWHDYQRDVLEALPHFSAYLDLTDLRNILVTLGYETQEASVTPKDLPAELMPALFVTAAGEVYLLKSKSGKLTDYFHGDSCEHRQGEITQRGKVYLLTDTSSQSAGDGQDEPWFSELIRRFHVLGRHLLGMTLILNIVAVCVPVFIMAVYDRVIGTKAIDSLPYFVIGIALALGVELGCRLLRSVTLGTLAGRIDYLIGTLSFRQILTLPPIMTERSSVTAQLSKLRQFDNIRDFFAGPSATTLLEAPFAVMFIAVIALLGGWLALIPVVSALLYFSFGLLWLPQMRRHLRQAARSRTARDQILMETFSGLRELKALGAESQWLDRFKECGAQSIVATRRASVDHAILSSVTSAMILISGTAILGFGTLQVIAGNMSVGALIAVMALSWRAQTPLQSLLLALARFDSIASGVKDLNQLMRLGGEKHGRKSSLLSGEIGGRITFDRVSFRYGQNLDPVLIGISLEVPEKGFLAVVGHNGAGKSTLLKLINGLYPIQSGTVFIDGVDTRQFDARDLRRIVAYVPQNPSLFRGTIAQNLRLKDPLATEDDIRLACFKTGILKMVEGLPEGFNTLVGDENTWRLPGGLIRGICIARAFVGSSPILLLDEPASGLDSDADEALMLQLRSLKGHATVIMASHRPSHIKLADRVLVIDRGMASKVVKPTDYYTAEHQSSGDTPNKRTRHG
ncbi:MAG: peptidase domain-containing ABC transporter [Pseudomonadota bacterium]